MANIRDPLELERIERASSRLRPIEREVLILSARERLGNGEIAARLGITRQAAEGHLADALYNLSRHLDRPERPWWKFW